MCHGRRCIDTSRPWFFLVLSHMQQPIVYFASLPMPAAPRRVVYTPVLALSACASCVRLEKNNYFPSLNNTNSWQTNISSTACLVTQIHRRFARAYTHCLSMRKVECLPVPIHHLLHPVHRARRPVHVPHRPLVSHNEEVCVVECRSSNAQSSQDSPQAHYCCGGPLGARRPSRSL